MKKYLGLVLSVILCAGLLVGCGKDYKKSDSTLFIEKKGKVVCTDVVEFDSSKYSEEEFEQYVDVTIEHYNNEYGEKKVKKDSLEFADGKCTLVLKYETVEDFARFNGYELFVGTVAEALANGYSFDDVEFAEISDEKASATSLPGRSELEDYQVVIFDKSYNVNVYGDLKYISVGNVSLVDESTVSFKFGNLLDGVESAPSTEDTEAVTESTETESTEEETEGTDEDLVDDGDKVFDFSGEPVPVVDSLGYVYIIFK